MKSRQVQDGYDYELFAAGELKRRGFRRIRQTAKSRDYGVDLLAEYQGRSYAVQCKYYTRPVDGSAVQEAVAGMAFYDCERALVITNSTFTDGARALAQANGVELFEGISPRPGFWQRRRPWELVLLAVQCVVFGLILREMSAQQTLSLRGVGYLLLFCFPVSYLTVRLLGFCIRLLYKQKVN